CRRRPALRRVMVGVLVALYPSRHRSLRSAFGRLRRHAGDERQPVGSGFNSCLMVRAELVPLVEAAHGQPDGLVTVLAKRERRAACGTKIPHGDVGTLKCRRIASCPDAVLGAGGDKGGERTADGLLAHAAVAQARVRRFTVYRVAYGAALASAGIEWLSQFHAGYLEASAGCRPIAR